MKKTLAILLSLALVVCMIPATASVAFGAEGLVVTLTADEVEYNGTRQAPSIASATYNDNPIDVKSVTGISDNQQDYVDAKTYSLTLSYTPEDGIQQTATVQYVIKQLDLSKIKCYVPELTDVDIKYTDNIVKKTTFGNISGEKLSDDIKAEISSDNGKGSAKVIFSAKVSEKNIKETSETVDVSYKKGFGGITVTPNSVNYTGKSIIPTSVTVKNNNDEVVTDSAYTISYLNNIHAGLATVRATAKSGSGYVDYVETTFYIRRIEASEAISKGILMVADITAKQTIGTTPKVVVSQSINGSWETVPETCYKVQATKNSSAGTGTATITFNENSNYTGSIEKEFTVVDAANDIGQAVPDGNVTVTNNVTTYNGAAQYPTVSIKNSSTIGSSNYVVKYEDSKGNKTDKPIEAGKYTVIIEGKNSYAGETRTTKTFTINQLDISEKNASKVTAVYSGKTSNPVTVKVGSNTLKENTDYTVSYNSSRKTYTITGIGSCYGTRTVYTTTKRISDCTATFSDNRAAVSYGPKYYPKVTVYDGKTKLTENTHYELSYKNSKNQVVSYCQDTGSYSVIITGIGEYTGTKTLTFTIGGTDISKYTVTLRYASVNATGSAQVPEIVSVKYGSNYSLTSNDYKVTYQDANGKAVDAKNLIAPGTYKVIVTGKNGYTGSTSTTFKIVGLTQTVTVEKDSYKVYPTSDFFKITAKASGEYSGFTYTSSNPAVASVSSAGYVTPKKVGRAVITVTAVGKNRYESASEKVEVKVYPSKAKLSNKPWTAGKKAQLKVRWGYQDGVTKYQVRYSRDKNFKAGTYLTKTVKAHGKDYTTQSTTLTKLKRGYTYYVKVRAVYTDPVTGDNYYGSWSGWRSAKTI